MGWAFGRNYSLWFFALLPFCPLPFCPFALLPFCPFALLPFCPHALALALVMVLLFIYVLAAIKRRHFLYLLSHFGSCADIVDSPDGTLACTDDNYDLLLWRQTTSLPFLAAIVEALSKHLKAWRCLKNRPQYLPR